MRYSPRAWAGVGRGAGPRGERDPFLNSGRVNPRASPLLALSVEALEEGNSEFRSRYLFLRMYKKLK